MVAHKAHNLFQGINNSYSNIDRTICSCITNIDSSYATTLKFDSSYASPMLTEVMLLLILIMLYIRSCQITDRN